MPAASVSASVAHRSTCRCPQAIRRFNASIARFEPAATMRYSTRSRFDDDRTLAHQTSRQQNQREAIMRVAALIFGLLGGLFGLLVGVYGYGIMSAANPSPDGRGGSPAGTRAYDRAKFDALVKYDPDIMQTASRLTPRSRSYCYLNAT
jgi:hypothetical protein